MRDLVIAGGGPVGIATALYAARAGLDVVVREPRAGPVDKACGEGLMPGAVADLEGLGVSLPGRPLTGIHYLDARSGSGGAQACFRAGPGRGVRRTTLHNGLSERLAEVAVPVEATAVRDVVDAGDHVVVDGEPARYLIAADGLHSPVRRMLGLDAPVAGSQRLGQGSGLRLRSGWSQGCGQRFGLRCHVEQAPWTSFVEVHWSRDAEAYVTPVGEDLIGVAVLCRRGARFEDALEGFPQLLARLQGPRTPVRGAGPLRQRARRRVAGRVLLVGDAGGYVDALTGEGIALGLAQARAAVEAILAGRPERFEAEARSLGRRHELLTRALLAATSVRPIRRLVVPAASLLPRVFTAAVNELATPIGVAR